MAQDEALLKRVMSHSGTKCLIIRGANIILLTFT